MKNETGQDTQCTQDSHNQESQSTKDQFKLDICNVCAVANLRCHLNLSHIAQNGIDVEYDSYFNVLKSKLRKPKVGLAQFWSNGKMSVFGCDSLENARKGCRILARRIKKLGYDAKFDNFNIVNILSKLILPFKIRIHEMVKCDKMRFMYEPELDPNLYYYPNPKNRGRKFDEYKTMAKITTNGKVTIHSSSMEEAQKIAGQVYELSTGYRYDEQTVTIDLTNTGDDESTNMSSSEVSQKPNEFKTKIFMEFNDDINDSLEESEIREAKVGTNEEKDEQGVLESNILRIQPVGSGINVKSRKRVCVQTYRDECNSPSRQKMSQSNFNECFSAVNGSHGSGMENCTTGITDNNGRSETSYNKILPTQSLSLLETQQVLDDLLS